MTRRVRVLPTCAAAATVGALIVGCGSTSSSTGSVSNAAATGSDQPAVQTAKAEVAKYQATQPPITVPTLAHRPPAGKTLAILTCALPACESVTHTATAAAKLLGWKVITFNTQLTPQGYQAAWADALQAHPDALAIEATTPNATVSKYIAQATKEHIAFVEIAPAGDRANPRGPMKAAYDGYPQFHKDGQLMGDVVVANAGSGAKAVIVEDPNLSPILGPVANAFAERIKAAGGTVTQLPVNSANTGKTIPSQVVSYLQSHPDVKWLGFELSDFDAGVAPAIQAAGLSGIKIVSRAPQASNLAAVKSGSEFAEVGEEDTCSGYRTIDGLIRLMTGVPLGTFATEPAGWHQIYVKSNVTQTSTEPQTPGCRAAFLKAWHVG